MNVASLELCKELYEVSGWGEDIMTILDEATVKNHWARIIHAHPDEWTPTPDIEQLEVMGRIKWRVITANCGDDGYGLGRLPAYDLGYLLRKLPVRNAYQEYLVMEASPTGYLFGYCEYGEMWETNASADTPEDAACKLAIESFKQGVLSKTNTPHTTGGSDKSTQH